MPWKAYRDGLKAGADDPMVFLDFDQVLPDVIGMNLGSAMNKRLKEATEAGLGLRAFSSTMDGPARRQRAAISRSGLPSTRRSPPAAAHRAIHGQWGRRR